MTISSATCFVLCAVALAAPARSFQSVASGADAKRALIDARTRAYEATVHNDAAALASALQSLEALTSDPAVGVFASYYASWTAWSLSASQVQAKDQTGAASSIETAVRHARRAVAQTPDSPDFQTMLAYALLSAIVQDPSRLEALAPDLRAARQRALTLGPRNPRAVMLDAGMIFYAPPERGGSHEKGIARWLEAIALLDEEAGATPADDLQPRWGRDFAYGWLSDLYLAATPPDLRKAKSAADKALSIRPDYWYVKAVLLPKLKDAR
jgi:hypothetical protein